MSDPSSSKTPPSATASGTLKQDGGAGSKSKAKQAKAQRVSTGDGAPSPKRSSDSGSAVDPASERSETAEIRSPGARPVPVEKKKEKQKKDKAEPNQKPESGDGGQQKSKSQLKAERRAIQEAQRAAKEAKKNEASKDSAGGSGASASAKKDVSHTSKPKPSDAGAGEKKGTSTTKKKATHKEVVIGETEDEMWARKEKEMLILFSYARRGKSLKIDNNILNLGFQYFHHHIVGANARCIAMLVQLREVISKYRTPPEKELCRDLEKSLLAPCITYINYCRPLSTSMGNAIKHLKYHISRVPSDMDDRTAIAKLQDVIDTFIQENILKASEAVALFANSKIVDGDVILVYAASSLICQVLKTAHKKGKKFRVIVVEGRPRTEGKTMLRFLVRCGIPCSYIFIGSATHAMGEATKVFLGAAAMSSIGDMHSRTGNSMIAALAQSYNIPVLVCCETYKFTDKVHLHSGDSNLHARGRDIIDPGPHNRPSILLSKSGDGEDQPNLLNLMYDVTRSSHITVLVTELGMLPCTSVPVVLRRQEDLAAEL